MKTIFDIGMYDGADTEYYLASGYKVVSIEANPDLVQIAHKKFGAQINSGQLIIYNNVISSDGAAAELFLSGSDLGSSSIFNEQVAERRPIGSVKISGTTLPDILKEHGVPYYIKIDIEGSDRFCVLSLDRVTAPQYLSFELGDDADELFDHMQAIGYTRFKIINQVSFRELANQNNLRDRLTARAARCFGMGEAEKVRRSGRLFKTGHSSGPAPWHSDGKWSSAEAVKTRFDIARATNSLRGWYDVHASRYVS